MSDSNLESLHTASVGGDSLIETPPPDVNPLHSLGIEEIKLDVPFTDYLKKQQHQMNKEWNNNSVCASRCIDCDIEMVPATILKGNLEAFRIKNDSGEWKKKFKDLSTGNILDNPPHHKNWLDRRMTAGDFKKYEIFYVNLKNVLALYLDNDSGINEDKAVSYNVSVINSRIVELRRRGELEKIIEECGDDYEKAFKMIAEFNYD